jgi:hypothetical protein
MIKLKDKIQERVTLGINAGELLLRQQEAGPSKNQPVKVSFSGLEKPEKD